MDKLQLLIFEIINKCNYAGIHPKCPVNREDRYKVREVLPDDTIVGFAEFAKSNGFNGYVAWHYYCEPTLNLPRIYNLTPKIRNLGLRTLLWTNGSNPFDSSYFDKIIVTEHTPVKLDASKIVISDLDDRIQIYDMDMIDSLRSCYRPLSIEMIIDYYGDLHLCCGDWKNKCDIGNIQDGNWDKLLHMWDVHTALAVDGSLEICRQCRMLPKSPIVGEEYKVC
jgi:hypothetical protein